MLKLKDLGTEFPHIDRVEVDLDEISKFETECQFMALAIGLAVETSSFVALAACTTGNNETWDRDHAAIGGNMVRLYKLMHSVLDQTCQRRQETAFILSRLVFETIVNIKFLIKNFSSDAVDSYIRHSLRHERRLRDKVVKNIEIRGGCIFPIEERMLKSIARSETASGISLDSVNLQDRTPWGGRNLQQKAEIVGLDHAYLAVFSGPSHSIHGGWQDIYANHLEWIEEGKFVPKTEWANPRPQILFALSNLIIQILPGYFRFMGGDAICAEFLDKLSDLQERIFAVDEAHEQYLAKKNWPEI